MTAHFMGNGGNAPKVSATHLVAVYDPADGRVVHMHHVLVMEGGKPVSAEQAEKEAVEHVKRRGRDAGSLRTLLAERHLHSHRGLFRVDVANQKLVPMEHPVRRRSG